MAYRKIEVFHPGQTVEMFQEPVVSVEGLSVGEKYKVEFTEDEPNASCSCGGVLDQHDATRCKYFTRLHPQNIKLAGVDEMVNGRGFRVVEKAK